MDALAFFVVFLLGLSLFSSGSASGRTSGRSSARLSGSDVIDGYLAGARRAFSASSVDMLTATCDDLFEQVRLRVESGRSFTPVQVRNIGQFAHDLCFTHPKIGYTFCWYFFQCLRTTTGDQNKEIAKVLAQFQRDGELFQFLRENKGRWIFPDFEPAAP